LKKSLGLIALVGITAILAAGCSSVSGPQALVAGSSLTIGESGAIPSLNTQVLAGPSSARALSDLAELTLPSFYSHDASGALTANNNFGTVTRDSSNNVTYRLSGKAKWADGVAISPADLALSWFAATDSKKYTLADGVTTQTGCGSALRLTSLALADKLTVLSDGIKLHFTAPVPDWKTALPLSVPAHLLGKMALPDAGLSDADAEKKVMDLVSGSSLSNHMAMALAFASGFNLPTDGSAANKSLLFQAGAYRIVSATSAKIVLAANSGYEFGPKPSVATLTLASFANADELAYAISAKKVDLASPVATTATSLAQIQKNADAAGLSSSVGDSGTNEVALLNFGPGSAFNAATWGNDQAKAKAAREGFFKFMPRAGMWNDLAGDSSVKKTDSLVFSGSDSDYQASIANNGTRAYQFQNAESSAEGWQAAKFDRTIKIRVVFDANGSRGQLEYSQLARLGKLGGFDVENDSSENPAATLASGQWDLYLTEQPRLNLGGGSLATAVGALTGFSNPQVAAIVAKVAGGDDLAKSSSDAKNLDQLLVENFYGLPVFQLQRLTVWSTKLQNYSPNSRNESLVWGYSNWSVSGKGK